ncbi:MAG: hypothetical protein QOH97_309 [Actinoplanes sp.]|nr:hypothetical protein [Actinoplanes sp.]
MVQHVVEGAHQFRVRAHGLRQQPGSVGVDVVVAANVSRGDAGDVGCLLHLERVRPDRLGLNPEGHDVNPILPMAMVPATISTIPATVYAAHRGHMVFSRSESEVR